MQKKCSIDVLAFERTELYKKCKNIFTHISCVLKESLYTDISCVFMQN